MKKLLCSIFLASASYFSFAQTINVVGVSKQLARSNNFSAYKINGNKEDCSKRYMASSSGEKIIEENVFSKLAARKGYDDSICEMQTGYICMAKVEVKGDSIVKIISVKAVKATEETLCNDIPLQP